MSYKTSKEIKFHKVSSMFRLMNQDELSVLIEDIKTNGLIEPIVTHEGQIADGRNRYNACKKLGVVPVYSEFIPNGVEKIEEYVFAKNFSRRHLTIEDRCICAIQYKDIIKIPQGGTNRGRNQWTDEKEKTGKNIDVHAFYVAAKRFNISHTTLSQVHYVKNRNEEFYNKIKNHELSINKAYRAVKKQCSGILRAKNKENELQGVNEILYSETIPCPAEFDSYEHLESYLKSITLKGWSFYMKVKNGRFYSYFQKSEIPFRQWTIQDDEPRFRRSIVVASKQAIK